MVSENSKEDDLETLVRGKINVNMLPAFKQQGMDSIVVEDEIYLIVRVGKISNFNSPNFVKLPVSVYITIEWVINHNKSRTVKLLKLGGYLFNLRRSLIKN